DVRLEDLLLELCVVLKPCGQHLGAVGRHLELANQRQAGCASRDAAGEPGALLVPLTDEGNAEVRRRGQGAPLLAARDPGEVRDVLALAVREADIPEVSARELALETHRKLKRRRLSARAA